MFSVQVVCFVTQSIFFLLMKTDTPLVTLENLPNLMEAELPAQLV